MGGIRYSHSLLRTIILSLNFLVLPQTHLPDSSSYCIIEPCLLIHGWMDSFSPCQCLMCHTVFSIVTIMTYDMEHPWHDTTSMTQTFSKTTHIKETFLFGDRGEFIIIKLFDRDFFFKLRRLTWLYGITFQHWIKCVIREKLVHKI